MSFNDPFKYKLDSMDPNSRHLLPSSIIGSNHFHSLDERLKVSALS